MDRRGVAAAVAVLSLALASCGASGPLTGAELAKRANAICRQRTTSVSVVKNKPGSSYHGRLAAAIPIESKALDELRALKPPASLRSAYGRYVAAQAAEIEEAKIVLSGRQVVNFEAKTKLIHESEKIATSLGLTDCN